MEAVSMFLDQGHSFHVGPLSLSNWNLEMLVFVEGGKPENQLQEKPLEQGMNQQQTQPKNGTKLETKMGHMGGGERAL